ncbi:polysaccharide pyruvyl transferase family protein [Saccharococcus caldoxylosilyticus]|uniref:polysaccharide pyruvyl transferase family protein n=1 Tax=Saccharococcus caldoxylosilyticus TaxID=81408 RepID=UPI0002EA118F|nr:polysaccharide pyruvyl transferase family protein [Parageobacillus caldoxylosilyticus]
MNKRIAFFGSVGYNIGDEAIAVAAAEYLQKNHKNIEIIISTLQKGVIEGRYNNLKEFVINRSSLKGWIRLIKFISSVDIVVIGGGTMVQDKLGISLLRGMIPYIFQITVLAKILKKPVITLPIGIDKLNTKLGRFLAKRVLNYFDKLCVRDEKSMLLANQYSHRDKTDILVSADPAFMVGDVVYRDNYNNTSLLHDNFRFGYVAISLVNENIKHENYHEALMESILWILSNTLLGIIFVPMDRRDNEEKQVFKRILREIEEIDKSYLSRVEILDSNLLSSVEITNILKNAKLLIAMRLHAMILSVGYTPIIGISRTTKTETFLNEFNLPFFDVENYIKPDEFKKVVSQILLNDKNSEVNKNLERKRIRAKKVEVIQKTLNQLLDLGCKGIIS